jgi:hypothetical protein
LGPSAVLLFSAAALRREGLRVRVIMVSRVVTCTFSVRRSSNELLAERGFALGFELGWPDVDRLWVDSA